MTIYNTLMHRLSISFIKYYPFDHYSKRTIIGLAAGFDKNCDLISYIHKLGFAFAEIGSLTPKENKGNKYSKIIKSDGSIINNLGLPNIGIDKAIPKLKQSKPKIPIFINVSALPYNTFQEVQNSIFKIQNYCSGIVLNLSCPNITNQLNICNKLDPEDLIEIRSLKPIYIKLAPNLSKNQLSDIVKRAIENNISGYILTNSLPTLRGGLSGRSLKDFSNSSIQTVNKIKSENQIIIGVGGIETNEDILEKTELGATYVELLSSWILSMNPLFVHNLNVDILNKKIKYNPLII